MLPVDFNHVFGDLLFDIFFKVEDPLDLGRIEQVCKKWKKILDDSPQIWSKHLLRIAPFSKVTNTPKIALIQKLHSMNIHFSWSKLRYEFLPSNDEQESCPMDVSSIRS